MFDDAKKVLVGGVNSPVRSCKAVKSSPKFIVKGDGPYIWDYEGNKYIDYVGSFGASIAGHANPEVLDFVKGVMSDGLGFSAPHPLEIEHANEVLKRLKSSDKIRFVNSGTEAVQTAIRLARGITGKNKIIKFAGCYHGHVDSVLVNAGSGALTTGMPNSPGIIGAEHTVVANYNNIEELERLVQIHGNEMAGIIVEPIAGNMGLVLPKTGFLEKLRQLCDKYCAILIFDEVMTGLRVHENSAQGLYNVTPDLTTLGKIIGGGLPVGAIAGPDKYMSYLSPEGPVYQAGTLSGNPITMASGLATLRLLQSNYCDLLQKHTYELVSQIKMSAAKYDIPVQGYNVGGMWGLFLSKTNVESLHDVEKSDINLFGQLYRELIKNGIYWPPSAFEAVFISIKHSQETMEATVKAFDKAFASLSCISSC